MNKSKQPSCQSYRHPLLVKKNSMFILRKRESCSPTKSQRKRVFATSPKKSEDPPQVIFPRRRRMSMNNQVPLKSEEYENNLRNLSNLNRKLQQMRESLILTEQNQSPSKLPRATIPLRRLSQMTQNTPVISTHMDFQKNVTQLLQSIRKNLSIFQKLFQSARNKLELVSKLYGWDDDFQSCFFEAKQIKSFTVEGVRNALGLERRTSKSKNYYNKLKLLLGELIRVNGQRETLLSEIQKQKISQQIRQIHNIQKHYYSSSKGLNRHVYDDMVKQTRGRVVDMKTRIKDKNDILKLIEQQTGGMARIDNFFRKQQQNLAFMETLLTKNQAEDSDS